jgi:hypothetical protein
MCRYLENFVNETRTRIVKFHGLEVKNIIVQYLSRRKTKSVIETVEEFDASKSEVDCEAINIQIVADFVTITFYKNESSNLMIRRELIPSHIIQHIWIEDLLQNNPSITDPDQCCK